MLDSTQDILNIAKTIGVILLAGTLGWFFYYLAMIMRQIFKAIKEMRARFKKIDNLIDKCKSKLGEGASGILHIAEGVQLIVDSINERAKGKKKTRKKKK